MAPGTIVGARSVGIHDEAVDEDAAGGKAPGVFCTRLLINKNCLTELILRKWLNTFIVFGFDT
jgi:hypothetical protein